MLFRRRKPVTISERIRALLWPRKGFWRGPRYVALRVLRLSSTPHSIAVGVAAGAASSFTPFFGLHIVIAVAFAFLFSGNLVAAAITTALANPVTIPMILTASYELGVAILGVEAAHAATSADVLHMVEHLDFSALWGPVFKPMLVGSLPLAGAAALVFYAAAYQATRLFQRRRRSRARDTGYSS
ncbi:DUF2062 domain-containing protein [Ensifer sp. MJa1]|uniref:DUF2062 domain-containing protein n=1 Tax=Ensifer sp. MJa1 TaxID=2919888 RepID=UPI0030085C65